MTTPRKITPEDQPVFPCWVWTKPQGKVAFWQKVYAERLFDPNRFGSRACDSTHWLPDQPTAPDCIPAPAAPNTGPNHRMEGATPRTDARKFTILSDLQSGTREVVDAEVSEQLERELAEANEYLGSRVLVGFGDGCFAAVDSWAKKRIEATQTELAALRARLLELEEDKADLDWLEAQRAGCNFGPRDNPTKFHCWIEDDSAERGFGKVTHYHGDTLRAAIRAARKGEK